MKTHLRRLLLTSAMALTVVVTPEARANIGETYGFGSRSAALGGATAAWGSEGFSAYANPAAIGLLAPEKRLSIGVATIIAAPSFLPISNVVVENAVTSDLAGSQTTIGNADTNYRATMGTAVGLAFRLTNHYPKPTLGVTAFLPLQSVTYMDTGESFQPEYVLHRSRTHRPQVEVALSSEFLKGFHVGVGLHTGFALSSNATVFLTTTPNHPSSMRFTASLKPKFAPFGGLLYTNRDNPGSRDAGSFSLATVVRAPMASTNAMVMDARAQILSGGGALGFNFNAASVLYYDPLSVEIGGSVQYTRFTRLFLQLDLQAWRLFEAPTLIVGDVAIDGCAPGDPCGVILRSGRGAEFSLKNLAIPRIGHEFTIGDAWSLRLGYSYRGSIFQTPPLDSGNLLDPPRHMMSAGMGVDFSKLTRVAFPCRLDFHLLWHHLVKQTVTKSPGDDNDEGTDNVKIGAPGYDVGGKILGGGLSLSVEI